MSQGRPGEVRDDAPRPATGSLARDLAVLRGEARGPRPERDDARRRRRRIWIGLVLVAIALGAAAGWRVWNRPW